jgi:EAL and modified HD-GYP domain-containing signal transduction protein
MTSLPSQTSNSANASQPTLAIARQAIVDDARAVFGYELFDRSVLHAKHTASSDAKMLFNVLSLPDKSALARDKLIFINCTLDSLAGGHLELVEPERVVLEIPALPAERMDEIETRLPTLQDMQQRGFRLAFDHTILTKPYTPWLGLASFIKFDANTLSTVDLERFIKLAKAQSHAQLIAQKVETSEQYLLVAKLGIRLFQGYWFAKPVLISGQTVRPAKAAVMQLINLVRKQASTNEIEELLKRNPTISFNLLRYINSAGFGLRNEVTSFKSAVMLLGLNKLFKWSALLLTSSQIGESNPALSTTAVVRGRLMELLAMEAGQSDNADNAFVVGLFSLIDALLQIPLDEALVSLTLPPEVTEALTGRSGPLAPLLDLALACETGDDAAFDSACQKLGLQSNQVNMAHLEALAWAENMAV